MIPTSFHTWKFQIESLLAAPPENPDNLKTAKTSFISPQNLKKIFLDYAAAPGPDPSATSSPSSS